MKILINDQVQLISGKDKGRSGKVTKIYGKSGRALVQGLNKYKRHMKKQSDKNPGGIIEVERPMPISCLMLICPHCHKPTRVGYTTTKIGEKYRHCRRCHQQITEKKTP